MRDAHSNGAIGARTWAIAEGYIPSASTGEGPELESHEAACMLNPGDSDAEVEVTFYFADREPFQSPVPRFDKIAADGAPTLSAKR